MITEHPIGVVSSNKDPAKAGRIKVQIPEMDGDAYPEWLDPIFPAGWITMPEVGDMVELVLPEGDDKIEFGSEVRYRGKVLTEGSPVPTEFKQNYPKRRGYKTKSGHLLLFDDTVGQEEVSISHKGVLAIVLNNSGIFLGTSGASERVPLGDLLMSSLSALTGALLTHTHLGVTTGPGITGVADAGSVTTWTAQKTKMDNASLVSDFVKTQKTRP